jgi:hypothetical protein
MADRPKPAPGNPRRASVVLCVHEIHTRGSSGESKRLTEIAALFGKY